MRKFLQNKLWRDKAIDLLEQNHGSRIHWRYLDDHEFDKQIRLKLLEEAQEAARALSHKELVDELADLFEVIDALCNFKKISVEEVYTVQTEKRIERGGFFRRKFVEIAEHPANSFGEKYCLASPEKYPEIID